MHVEQWPPDVQLEQFAGQAMQLVFQRAVFAGHVATAMSAKKARSQMHQERACDTDERRIHLD